MSVRRFLRRMRNYWSYVRRGHAIYISFAINLLNTLVIQYRFLVQNVQFLDKLIPSLTIFALTALPTWAIISLTLGYFDYTKGSVKSDSELTSRASPYVQDFTLSQKLIMEAQLALIDKDFETARSKLEEGREVVDKWIRK